MAHSDTPLILVASQNQHCIEFIDPVSGSHVGRVEIEANEPHELTVDDRRGFAYVAHTYHHGVYGGDQERGREVSVVDVNKRALVDVIDLSPFGGAHDVEYDATHDLVYTGIEAGESTDGGVLIIDPEQRTVVGRIATDAPNSHWLALAPDDSTCFVSHKDAGIISVLDLETRRCVRTIDVPEGTEELDYSHDGRFVFAVSPTLGNLSPTSGSAPQSRVIRIDATSGSITGEVELKPTICGIRVAPDGRVLVTQLFPENEGEKPLLWVIDPNSMEILGRVPLGANAFTIRVIPDSSTAYISDPGLQVVHEVDLTNYSLRRQIENPIGNFHGLALAGATNWAE